MQKIIKNLVKKHPIVLFTKATCPHSQKAKALFEKQKKPFHEVELSALPNGDEYLDALKIMTGARTVPRIFVNGVFKGGFDDVNKLIIEGKLFVK